MKLTKQLHFNSHMGGMGNQMFSYACAKHLELQHGFTCSLDDISKLKYFELVASGRVINRIKLILFFHIAKRFKGMDVYNLEFDDMVKDYSVWLQELKNPSMIWGYFQSEKYFKDSSERIKSCFKVKKLYQPKFRQFLSAHNLKAGQYNAVHIRRTDYIGFKVKGLQGDNFALPSSYFKKGLTLVNTKVPLLIVSDDPEYCKQEFNYIENAVFSTEDSITDFQILSNAKELVISNSTFAWWAAWLNPHNPNVICPKFFLGFKEDKEVPINIYPDNWVQITF